MRKTIVTAMWITCAILLGSCGGGSGNLLGPGGGDVAITLVEPASVTSAPTNTRIVVKFDTPMNGSSINNDTFQLLRNSVPVPADNVLYDSSTQQATLIPKAATTGAPALATGTTYTVSVAAGVTTAAGLVLVNPQTIDFTTEEAPSVTVDPVGSGVPVPSSVKVTFSKPVTGVEDNTFYVESGGVRVAFRAPVPNSDNTIFSRTPLSSLKNSTAYTVTVTNGVKDNSGNPLAPISITTFTTVGPTVIPIEKVLVPANSAGDVSVTTAVTAAFSDPVTIPESDFRLIRKPDNSQVPGKVTGTGKTVTFTPDFQLSPQSTYEATIIAGSSGLRANVVWTFTTSSAGQRIDLRDVAAGVSHAVALGQDGKAWAWGGNAYGQLGDGLVASRSSARRVVNLQGTVVQVGAGETHSLALLDNGSVFAWGGNAFGQLGDNTVASKKEPVQVQFPDGVIVRQISTQKSHNLALDNNGTVWAWGANAFGQLGDNTATAARLLPVKVVTDGGYPLTDIFQVSAGGSHSLALDNVTGQVWQWGRNGPGELDVDRHAVMVKKWTDGLPMPDFQLGVPGIGPVIPGIGAGDLHSVALDTGGDVYTWGSNEFGQLGNGASGGFVIGPVQVQGFDNVVGGAWAGSNQTIMIVVTNPQGLWKGWGQNDQGQLCDGTTTQRNSPVQMLDFDGVPLNPASEPSAGGSNVYFIKNISRLYGCGSNASGQLGTGVEVTELPQSALPVQVYFNLQP